jgi:hypothetical protein
MGDITKTTNFRPGVLQGQGQYNSYLQQHRDQIRSGQSQSSVRQHHLPHHMPLSDPMTANQNQNVTASPPPAYHMTTTITTPPPDPPLMMSQSQPMKGWGNLPQDFIQKIVELKRLLYRHPNAFPNPEIIIQGCNMSILR